ncbi:MAG: hypothetical protein LBQ68_09785, partial [Clostridiales bacterium]|nr:hypothetical protein [Clostridiales bacterium]
MLKENSLLRQFTKIITNRCLITFVVIFAIFYMLLSRLFYLQLVMGEEYLSKQNVTGTREVSLPASRGNIYDRLGRPLAINKSAYIIKMDASKVKIDADNLHDFIKLMESKNETIVDKFPITKTMPYQFDFTGIGNTEKQWKLDMGFESEEELNMTASDCFEELIDKFKISPATTASDARKILNLCSMLYAQRYQAWEPIIIAYDVKLETLAIIEEETVKYEGFSADVQSLRYYPENKYFAHIVGYYGKISSTEYETNKDKYRQTDLIGKNG